jgi:two-component system OmpR family sensor kinase
MNPGSLESRLTFQQQGLALLVIAAFAVSALWITRATLSREEGQSLVSAAERIALSLDLEYAEEPNLVRASETVLHEESVDGFRITIEDSLGRPIATNVSRRAGGSSHSHGEIREARARTRSGLWVAVATSDRLRKASLSALARALLLTAIPLLLFTFALSRWTVRRALRPLQEMTVRAGAVSLDDAAQSIGGAGGLAELERLRVAFDRLLERLNEQLRAERQFASDASHELRTPLTVLSGEIELARSQGSPAEEARASLGRAAEQVRSMRDLVEALMLLRRAGDGPQLIRPAFEPVDLSDVVEGAIQEVAVRYPDRRNDIETHAELDVVISGHPVLLAAGVRNLLDNAIKFTEAGTRVRTTVAQDENWARVTIEDGGRGIRESDRERVFDPFFRGTEARAGSTGFGLGLPILRRVARVHGGDVTIERSSLGGARIALALPRWRPAAIAQRPA